MLLFHADVQPKKNLHVDLEAGCRVPVLQLMISHAMRAKDPGESRSSSLMGEGCEAKGREGDTSEGKSKEVIMRWEEDDTRGIKHSFWGALKKLVSFLC